MSRRWNSLAGVFLRSVLGGHLLERLFKILGVIRSPYLLRHFDETFVAFCVCEFGFLCWFWGHVMTLSESDVIDQFDDFMRRCAGMCIRIRYSDSCITAWSTPLNNERGLDIPYLKNVALGVASSESGRNVVRADKK